MNKEQVKKDLIELCNRHKVTMYADEEEPCTVIEDIADAKDPDPQIGQIFFKSITDENFWTY